MNRTCLPLLGLLLWAGCTVPSLQDFEKESPRACDAQHACAEGYQCVEGLCCMQPTHYYPDTDGDGYGSLAGERFACTLPNRSYVTQANDCDDSNPDVHPGMPDICDGKDNDCDEAIDEDVNLREPCTTDLGCSRHRSCASDGGTQCDYDTPPPTWYPDEDLDSRGRTDAGVMTCAPDAGYILDAGDCNDGNPFTYAEAPELCDQEDNNCDGVADESSVCPTGAKWVEQKPLTEDWRSVAVWGDGGVWIVGGTDKFLLRKPGESLQNVSTGCGEGAWFAVAADPVTGRASVRGTANSAATLYLTPPCKQTFGANADFKGVVFVKTGGGLDTFSVGVDNAGSSTIKGHAYREGVSGAGSNTTAVGPLFDVHGISREVAFAVGGINLVAGTSPGTPQIYRFNTTTNDWTNEGVDSVTDVVKDRLRGVWVVNNKLAYAVGDSNGMLKWNGTAWSAMTGPAPGQSLYSVLAFGSSSIYVVTSDGRVFRFNGSTWKQLFSINGGTALFDIAGSRPDDLWVVGAGGKLAHWPQ